MKRPSVTAILLSAGASHRMAGGVTKQLIKIAGTSVIRRTALAFASANTITNIIVVAKAEELSDIKRELSDIPKLSLIVAGGECRAESAKIGFLAVKDSSDFVAIHDGARCLVTPDIIDRVVLAGIEHGAASAGAPVTDTVKKIDGELYVLGTVRREELYFTTTPQVFSAKMYEKALNLYSGDLSRLTDDNMLIEAIGARIKLIDCGKENIKITTAEDIDYAEFLLKKRENNA